MSNSVRPHRWKPPRLPCPWDLPGKNTGVSCHFLLQCMKVKSESEVAQSYPTPSNPMDCSLPGSSIHGIFQARVLEWVAIAFSIKYLYLIPKIYLPMSCRKFPNLMLCDNLEGWNGVGSSRWRGHRYTCGLIHVDRWQKPTQYCKAITLQLKINKSKQI